MWHLTLSRSRPPPRLVSVRVKEQYIKSAVGFSSQANLQLECVLPIGHFAGFCAIKSWEGRDYFLYKDPLKFWKSLKPVPPHCRPRFSQAESCTTALISSFHHSIRPFGILYGLKRVVWRRQKLNERFHNISFFWHQNRRVGGSLYNRSYIPPWLQISLQPFCRKDHVSSNFLSQRNSSFNSVAL